MSVLGHGDFLHPTRMRRIGRVRPCLTSHVAHAIPVAGSDALLEHPGGISYYSVDIQDLQSCVTTICALWEILGKIRGRFTPIGLFLVSVTLFLLILEDIFAALRGRWRYLRIGRAKVPSRIAGPTQAGAAQMAKTTRRPELEFLAPFNLNLASIPSFSPRTRPSDNRDPRYKPFSPKYAVVRRLPAWSFYVVP